MNSTIIAATAIQAPWVTLVANTTTSTTAVNTAPTALMAWERRIDRRVPPPIPPASVTVSGAPSGCRRSRVCQCLTMPNWDSVKLVNTPTMYSWISRSMLASNPMINAAAAAANNTTPLENTNRSPRLCNCRGDRLVFSNGVVLLAAAAAALIIGFDANIDRLIQLYIVGVFTSFTLSQFGMVKH